MKPSRSEVVLEGLLQLPGLPDQWIWAFTCPTPGCDCRTALVLATTGGRDALVSHAAPVRDAWVGKTGHAKAAAGLDDIMSFAIDIDEGSASPTRAESPRQKLDLDAHPEVLDVAARIDGEVLDAIGRLWYRGKGLQDPEEPSAERREVKVRNWSPGDTVAWGEAFESVRYDMYRFGDRVFEAIEHYCVKKDCDCAEVIVDFQPVVPRGAPQPGAVRIDGSGAVTLEPYHERHRERLEQLWEAYRKRYPRFAERFARRVLRMHAFAGKLVGVSTGGAERSTPKVGRNDPCPCGSGKKHKKCCGGS